MRGRGRERERKGTWSGKRLRDQHTVPAVVPRWGVRWMLGRQRIEIEWTGKNNGSEDWREGMVWDNVPIHELQIDPPRGSCMNWRCLIRALSLSWCQLGRLHGHRSVWGCPIRAWRWRQICQGCNLNLAYCCAFRMCVTASWPGLNFCNRGLITKFVPHRLVPRRVPPALPSHLDYQLFTKI